MRHLILAAACGLFIVGPAEAGPIRVEAPFQWDATTLAAQNTTRAFRRCMRKRYGPHYFRGVKRTHRYFMAQACGG